MKVCLAHPPKLFLAMSVKIVSDLGARLLDTLATPGFGVPTLEFDTLNRAIIFGTFCPSRTPYGNYGYGYVHIFSHAVIITHLRTELATMTPSRRWVNPSLYTGTTFLT